MSLLLFCHVIKNMPQTNKFADKSLPHEITIFLVSGRFITYRKLIKTDLISLNTFGNKSTIRCNIFIYVGSFFFGGQLLYNRFLLYESRFLKCRRLSCTQQNFSPRLLYSLADYFVFEAADIFSSFINGKLFEYKYTL